MPRPLRQTGEAYQLRGVPSEQSLQATDFADMARKMVQALGALVQEQNALLARLTTRLDRLEGLNGTPVFYSAVNANGMQVTNLGDPVDDRDAMIKALALAMDRSTGQFDAQGVRITNGAEGIDIQDFVTVSQLQQNQEANALITGESFVVIGASGLLTAERVLTGEATVITINDAGAGSTVTIEVTAAGITHAKIQNSAAVSVLGRSANSAGVKADIAAAANGNVLRRAANVVGFGQVDLADGTNAVTGTLGTGNGGRGATTGPAGAYTVANPTTDRALDVTGDTLAQGLAVLGTLIADLQAWGAIT